MRERERLTLDPIADEPEVGRWLSAMEDCRRDTLKAVEGLVDSALGMRPPGSDNDIGSVLYHVALIEADWLLVDIFGEDVASSTQAALLPFTDRDAAGQLTHVGGESLAQHLDRLAAVRAVLLDRLRPMREADFHRPRARPDYDVSPAWVIHHLLQHEAEHRSEIVWLRARLASD
jgi:uncharacterized damage-inducible protein DinB